MSHRIKQQVYGPLAFGGSLPRGAQSSYLTSDHHPVGTEPASVRGISRGRALYRRHVVLDCLRCQWERGTASYRRHIFCLLVPVQCGRETHHTIPADRGLESDWQNCDWQDIMKHFLWTRGVEKEFTDGNKNQQD